MAINPADATKTPHLNMAAERALGKACAIFEGLEQSVREADAQGRRADEVAREAFDCLLQIGPSLLETFVLQGETGDTGRTVERHGQPLQRLSGKQTRA